MIYEIVGNVKEGVRMLLMKAERNRRGWSQMKLAVEAKMHPAEISKIENCKLVPGSKQRGRLSAALGVPENLLLSEVSPDGNKQAL